jgi:hypothetical protein
MIAAASISFHDQLFIFPSVRSFDPAGAAERPIELGSTKGAL